MKVKKLIQKLKKQDPNKRVFVPSDGFFPYREAKVVKSDKLMMAGGQDESDLMDVVVLEFK